MAPRILLTGPPGCGKTTVIMRTLERPTFISELQKAQSDWSKRIEEGRKK